MQRSLPSTVYWTGSSTYTSTSTRYNDAVEDVDGRRLYLDTDCAEIVTIHKRGRDSGSGHPNVTVPRNSTPYREIVLKSDSGVDWTLRTAMRMLSASGGAGHMA
jgi:hypothetical protein